MSDTTIFCIVATLIFFVPWYWLKNLVDRKRRELREFAFNRTNASGIIQFENFEEKETYWEKYHYWNDNFDGLLIFVSFFWMFFGAAAYFGP